MQIQGTNRIHSPQGINAPHFSTKSASSQSNGAPGKADRVEISPAANAAIEAAESGSKVRSDLVNLIRSQIAAGTYDTPEKMEVAMERMLDQMG
jgi:negative regulator of flagellin synthesis FlgM